MKTKHGMSLCCFFAMCCVTCFASGPPRYWICLTGPREMPRFLHHLSVGGSAAKQDLIRLSVSVVPKRDKEVTLDKVFFLAADIPEAKGKWGEKRILNVSKDIVSANDATIDGKTAYSYSIEGRGYAGNGHRIRLVFKVDGKSVTVNMRPLVVSQHEYTEE